MMKVAVIGANGQLGCDVCKAFEASGHNIIKLNHADINIENFDATIAVLRNHKPAILVNTAAMHNVDECEEKAAKAFDVNGLGARNLALISNELNFSLIHISTDYVFDGLKETPYIESDCPIPLNVYGNSKLSGENFVRAISNRYFIVRVSAIYGENPCRAKGGKNFIQLMLHLAEQGNTIRVVDDEIVSPTYTLDIANQVVALAKSEQYGVYHMTSQGTCSWHQFATQIFQLAGKDVDLAKADPGEFPTKANRPKYSVLENNNLKSRGLDIMPDWQNALERYMALLIKS